MNAHMTLQQEHGSAEDVAEVAVKLTREKGSINAVRKGMSSGPTVMTS